MRRMSLLLVAALLALGLLAGGGETAGKIRIVASLPDLKSLTEAVGGDLVEVETLARGDQNAHDIEVRPSLMVKLRRASLLIRNGLGFDSWVEPLLQGSNNARLFPGGSGYVDVSPGIPLLGVPTGRVDRSMGDVHPEGNPHFTLDPATVPIVTSHIVEGLARVAPEHRTTFEARRGDFLMRLEAAARRWQQVMAPLRGSKVIVYHDTWPYLLQRFGLMTVATVEDRPGIPPSPTHLASLIRQMKEERIRVLLLEPWADRKLAERIAADAGAKVVLLAHAVGALRGTDSYLEMLEYNVSTLAQALR